MVKSTTNAKLYELANNSGIQDAYLNSVYMWLLSAAAEINEHNHEAQGNVCDAQHINRLHRAVCMMHTAQNSMSKYAEDFTGSLRTQAMQVIDTFYETRYAHEDMLPDGADDPMLALKSPKPS